jgi:hypothetical protein
LGYLSSETETDQDPKSQFDSETPPAPPRLAAPQLPVFRIKTVHVITKLDINAAIPQPGYLDVEFTV